MNEATETTAVEVDLTTPATPESVLAKQGALNTRITNLKKWVLASTKPGKKRQEALANLEQAHADLMKAIMEELV